MLAEILLMPYLNPAVLTLRTIRGTSPISVPCCICKSIVASIRRYFAFSGSERVIIHLNGSNIFCCIKTEAGSLCDRAYALRRYRAPTHVPHLQSGGDDIFCYLFYLVQFAGCPAMSTGIIASSFPLSFPFAVGPH